jgi:16S rRNA (cytidine1402-2'-O)-methyltransferase
VPGKLLVVATPLGNLDDLTPRALDALRSAEIVLCEDTRRTAKLLARYGVEVPTLSHHRFNEKQRIESILARLRAGQNVAMVSDGGTPGVSDPGSLLVGAALRDGITVSPLPGPSAVAALLSASGLPADRYVFEGFLPSREGERRRHLRALRQETRTLVFFEAPRRLIATLRDMEEVLGPREVVLGRELTKLHEEILRGTAAEIASRLGDEVRGEVTLAVAGADPSRPEAEVDAAAERILECWRGALAATGGDRRAALRQAARELGLKRPELYRKLSELGHDVPD